MSRFFRASEEDILWINLDQITTVRDDCITRNGKTTYRIAVWTADSNNALILHGGEAINLMRELGLPLSVVKEDGT